MVKKTLIRTGRPVPIVLCLTLLVILVAGTGCNPARYFARNACDIVNCDILFFVEDVFPLSTRPTGGGGGGASEGDSGGASEDEGEDDGGHAGH